MSVCQRSLAEVVSLVKPDTVLAWRRRLVPRKFDRSKNRQYPGPPTIHHEETGGDCEVDVVANQARAQKVRCAVSTSLGFGGNDSAIVMRALR